MKAQGLPYMKNREPIPKSTPTEYFGPQSFQEFLLASGKQLDFDGWSTKGPQQEWPENLDRVGARHAQLLVRLLEACSELAVSKVVSSMKEEQLDIMNMLVEACPRDITSNVVDKLIGMDAKHFNMIGNATKSLPKERLATLVKDLAFVDVNFLEDFLLDMEEALLLTDGIRQNIDVAKSSENKEKVRDESNEEKYFELTCYKLDEKECEDGIELDLRKCVTVEQAEETVANEDMTKDKSLGNKDLHSTRTSCESMEDVLLDGIKDEIRSEEKKGENQVEDEAKEVVPIKHLLSHQLYDKLYTSDNNFVSHSEDGNGLEEPADPVPTPSLTPKDPKKRKKIKSSTEECTCPICEMPMKQNSPSDLERHIATHTGERNFNCKECGSKF